MQSEVRHGNLYVLRRSIFAGVCISIGGTAYLSIGGIVGAFLFSFGLLAVVHYGIPLYTGKCGFIKTKEDALRLPVILAGNITGAFFTAMFIKLSKPGLIIEANKIIDGRMGLSILQVIFLSLFCGIIMTVVVRFARKKKYIPLLIGIPLFIVSGFIHSIADAFYYAMASYELIAENWSTCLILYLSSVVGNFIGCVIPNEFEHGIPLFVDDDES